MIERTNTILYCRNWNQTVRFYRDVLDLVVHFETDWFVEFHLTAIAYLSIADAACATIPSGGGDGVTLSFRVTDIESEYRRLISFGITPGPMETKWGSRTFFFRDPEGHRIELWS